MRRVGRLHVMTDTVRQERHDHAALARLAIEGGADTIQFREKRGTTRERIAIARELVAICRAAGVPLIVNDRVDIALAADAAGVHLGRGDFPISLARRMLGPDRIVGGSAATAEEAAEVMWAGADYVGIGPVFATASKADAGTPLGAEQLAGIAGDIEIPVLAVGGITAAEISRVFAAGAHGVAVIGAVALSEDPKAAVQSLRQAIDAALPGES